MRSFFFSDGFHSAHSTKKSLSHSLIPLPAIPLPHACSITVEFLDSFNTQKTNIERTIEAVQ